MSVLPVVSALVALACAVTTAVLGYWQQRRLRALDQRNLMDAYGASLAWAAFDLQTRLFNILNGHAIDRAPGSGSGFVTAFLIRGNEQEAEFVRRSTVFVLAEYLGWVEILRRDVRFLDLGRSRTNREIMAKVLQVGAALSKITPDGNELRLFRAHQRAIGELMVHPDGEPGQRRCLGYAEFCAYLDADPAFRGWFERLLADVDRLAVDTAAAVPRLQDVQRQLIGLLDLLDPAAERFPSFREVFDPGRAPRPSHPPVPEDR